MPITEPIVFLGNMSETVVKRLADHAWCAEAPMPIKITGIQKEIWPNGWAASTTSGMTAISNIAFILPSYGEYPLLIKYTGNQPPPMLPNMVILYKTKSGIIISVPDMPYWASRYLGNQNRKNHH